MKLSDILSSAMNNLLRRKLRSLLTMLGVVIGTAAIVVTMSLGYGAEKAQMEMLESYTNLRVINVYPYYSYYDYDDDGSSNSTRNRITKITDSIIARIRAISGVAAVTPVVNCYMGVDFVIMTGDLECSTQIIAVNPNDFGKIMGLKNGRYFSNSTDKMEFLMSEISMVDFRNPEDDYEYVDYWSYLYNGEEMPLPDVNWLHDPFTLQLRWYDYSDTDENDYEPKMLTKDYKAKFIGTLDTGSDDYTFSYGAVVSLPWLRKLYRDNRALFKEMGFSRTSLENYENVYVLADNVDNVSEVVKALSDIGVMCSSPLDYVNSYKQQIQTVQGFLGFIGAISMLVAALMIANTMMMSIYERTREIGVMKVLGCKLGNIRMMFLAEAAYIGVFGGLMGLGLSYLMSYALNNVAALRDLVASFMSSTAMFSEGGTTSLIPPSLSLSTWAGVTAISILSGVYPAQRAMTLSSLAAIRNSD